MQQLMKKARQALGSGSVLGDERGLSTVEYVVLLVLIVAISVVSWNTLGHKISGKLAESNILIETNVK